MKPPSEVFDLLTADGTRHANAKVMAFLTTLLVTAITGVGIYRGYRFTWPAASILAAILLAPYGLDSVKTIAKLRWPMKLVH